MFENGLCFPAPGQVDGEENERSHPEVERAARWESLPQGGRKLSEE